MDISWKQAMLAVVAMCMVVAVVRPSAFDEPVTATTAATPAPAAKVVVEKHTMPIQPDGFMTKKDCASIPNGMQVADLVFKYGWPSGDNAFNNFGEQFYYPIHKRRDDVCLIDFDDNKVTSTLYQVD